MMCVFTKHCNVLDVLLLFMMMKVELCDKYVT